MNSARTQFILTPELGRLAKWLRILGYDAVYFSRANFPSLLIQALRDNRIILTRNSRFIDKVRAAKSLQIKSDEVSRQLKQVLKDLNIKPEPGKMFSRCIICNTELRGIEKQQVTDKVPEYVFRTQEEFFTCPSCWRIYWPGTHWGSVNKTLKEISDGIRA
ncbi:MAG: Mut7-C RNAse domain-containing protein [Candidatus Omnitrophota bacterium]